MGGTQQLDATEAAGCGGNGTRARLHLTTTIERKGEHGVVATDGGGRGGRSIPWDAELIPRVLEHVQPSGRGSSRAERSLTRAAGAERPL